MAKKSKVVWPLDGRYGKDFRTTSPFGWRTHPIRGSRKHHNGEDMVGQRYVRAIAGGTVLKARKSNHPSGGFGYYIVIRHMIDGTYYTSLYAHLKGGSFQVKKGSKVKAGQVIGVMGTSGASTGVHLHLEIWKGRTHGWSSNGKGFADPVKFLKAHVDKDAANESIGIPTPDPELDKYKAPADKPAYTNPIKRGSRGEEVAFIQKYLGIKVDGVFGSQTHEAVLRFMQKHEDIKVKDGVIGPITWRKFPEKLEIVEKSKTHKVKRGEYLSLIANKYDATVAELVELNDIDNPSLISVGQVLKLPSEEIVQEEPPIDPPPAEPKVCECCKQPLDN